MNAARWSLRVLLLSLAFAGAAMLFGWWTLPILGGVWGIVGKGTQRPAATAGVAAAVGWAILLGWSAATGPVGLLADKLGGIAGIPGGVFIGLTILLPFALAFSAARVAKVLRSRPAAAATAQRDPPP